MGERVLVIMTNGDVYYINRTDGASLVTALHTSGTAKAFSFTDLKSGAKVVVSLGNVSSLVKEG